MEPVVHSNNRSKGVGTCFVASLAGSIIKNGDDYQLSIIIKNHRVDAVIQDCEEIDSTLMIGTKLVVEGNWSGAPMMSVLHLKRLSVQSTQPIKELSNQNRNSPLLSQLLSQLRPSLRFFVEEILTGPLGKNVKRNTSSLSNADSKYSLAPQIEQALMAGQLAFTWLNRAEAELTMVAALLDGLGQSGTSVNHLSQSVPGHDETTVSHNTYSMDSYLNRLEDNWQIGAQILRDMLSRDSSHTRVPSFPGTVLVNMVSQFSTALRQRSKAFEGQPSYHYYAIKSSSQQYLRIPL